MADWGVSRLELHRESGISYSTLTRWFQGKADITLASLNKIYGAVREIERRKSGG